MIRALSLLLLLLVPAAALAGGTCSGVKGGCGRSSSRSSSGGSSYSSGSGGTVHVSGYTRKDGTYVRPHTRHASGTATHVEVEEYVPPPSPLARTTARTGARITARTTAWNGNVTDHDDTPVVVSRTAPPPSTKLPAKYVVYFTTGRMQQITNYEQDGDGFLVYGTSGGHIRYPKDRIDHFEALPTSGNPKLRIWTSIDGKFSVEAEFVSEEGGKVKLRKTDGTVIEVESEKLSKKDRDWIREHA
jgi:hypothetical protein